MQMRQVSQVLPKWQEVAREGLIVVGGALLAAVVIGSVPGLRQWIKNQWGDTPNDTPRM